MLLFSSYFTYTQYAFLGVFFLLSLALKVHALTEKTFSHGTVRGQVVVPGLAAYRGIAALWPAAGGRSPDPKRYVLIPVANSPLQEEGKFEISAAPGHYFLGAIVRIGEGPWQGPPRVGDRVFMSPDSQGNSKEVTIIADTILETGRHTDSWVFDSLNTEECHPRISGTLWDNEGNPVVNLLVFAFNDPELTNEPLAVSTPSDKNGRYTLCLDRASEVYLRAREHIGIRRPQDGGKMGVYGGDKPVPVQVSETQSPTAIDIQIIDIPNLKNRQEINNRQKKGN